jgi:hypothetical protein
MVARLLVPGWGRPVDNSHIDDGERHREVMRILTGND